MALETIYACGSAPRPTCLIFLATSSPIRRRSRTDPVGERGAKGRGIEGRDVSACRSGLFILSPADTPAMILTRRGEAFSPKEKKRRRDEGEECGRGRDMSHGRLRRWLKVSFSTLFEGSVYNGLKMVFLGW